MKTVGLSEAQVASLTHLAEQKPFFLSILKNYRKYQSLTEKQYRALQDEEDETFLIDGVAVVNRLLRNGQLLCFHCRAFALYAVGVVGVCAGHVPDQSRLNEEYAAKNTLR